MNFVLLSDLELRATNPICRLDDAKKTQMEKLDWIFKYAEAIDAPVIVAGDFFDTPRSWYVPVEMLILLKKYSRVQVYTVYGQHDMYYYSEKTKSATSLGFLIEAGYVTLLGSEGIVVGDEDIGGLVDGPEGAIWADYEWEWYGCSFGQPVPKPTSNTPNMKKGLAIHAPIAKKALWPGQKYMDARAFLIKHSYYDLILCGDIHRTFQVKVDGRYIVNPGPMLRADADEYMMSHKPQFCSWRDEEVKLPITMVEIPHKGSDEVMSRKHIEEAESVKAEMGSFVSSVEEVDFESAVDPKANVYRYLEENKIEQDVVDILSATMGGKDG